MVIIDGKIVEGKKKIEVRNPASYDQIVEICDAADSEQATEAVKAAWKAYPCLLYTSYRWFNG